MSCPSRKWTSPEAKAVVSIRTEIGFKQEREEVMKILVFGAGGFFLGGGMHAARLNASGHDVTVLARVKRFDEINGKGIALDLLTPSKF